MSVSKLVKLPEKENPLESRPGADGFGIDVTTLARRLVVEVQWPVETELNFQGLVFV